MFSIKKAVISIVCFFSFSQILLAGNTVGIIAAMPEEIASLSSQKISVGQYIETKINGHKVVMALSGAGKVNAAMTAQRLISEYDVNAIIFTGVAGAINQEYEIGDIVIADRAFQHDYGYLGEKLINHKPGTMPELRLSDGSESFFYKLNDLKNWDDILVSVKELEVNFNAVNGYKPKLRSGTVATGDQFIASVIKNQELRSLGADAVEMEGAAVAQVAAANKIPCIIIRSISDRADHHADIDFPAFLKAAASNNAEIVRTIVDNM